MELVPQSGLLFSSPGKRWLHVLSDLDASNVREAFIELPPFRRPAQTVSLSRTPTGAMTSSPI